VAKRLQLILEEPEYREIQRAARSRHALIAEWIRQALELALRRERVSSTGEKLEIIRAAAQHEFPVGDIGDMLAEIQRGPGTNGMKEHP
jgi:hypothetical protein